MRGVFFASFCGWSVLFASEAVAQGLPDADRFELWAHGESHAFLFRRALLPGRAGVLAVTETVTPLRQDVRLAARDLDTGWRKDSVDIDFAAWGLWSPGDPVQERIVDGDIQTANVAYRHGPVSLRLGRQVAAGGAARYARFDGIAAIVDASPHLRFDAYGGLSVLPRWNGQPGYYYLGAAADSNLRDPDALPVGDRAGFFLLGGRVGYRDERFDAGLSAHEQHEPRGVARRNLGLDARASLTDEASAGASSLLDIDSRRVADARLWADAALGANWDVSAEVLHAEPALLLSRQSVLAVFSTAAYEEGGARAAFRPVDLLEMTAEGWVQLYEVGHPGARTEVAARLTPPKEPGTSVRVAYGRVIAPDNGYHSVRAALSRRFVHRLTGTLDVYGYFYDEPIASASTSSVFAGMLSWQATQALELMAASSLSRSPYALSDAQAQIRASYAFDFSASQGRP